MEDRKQNNVWYNTIMLVVGAVIFLIGMYEFYFSDNAWGQGLMIIGGTLMLMALLIAIYENLLALTKRMTRQQQHSAFNVSARTSPNATDTLPYQGRWKDEPVNKL